MEDFDCRQIRQHLPVGAIAEIAERCKTTSLTISNIFNRDVRSKYRNMAVAMALEIIDAKKVNPELLAKAKVYGFTTGSLYSIPYQRKKKHLRSSDATHPMDWFRHNKVIVLLVGLGVGIFLLRKKLFPQTTTSLFQ